MSDNVIHLGSPELHFWLTRSVARAMGVNLSEAMARGELSADGYAALVTRCRQCPHVASCETWLATGAVQRCEALEVCANREVLERLQ
ncbi:DUF6455 family protein [Marimonas lutisalis]|uniref:DUF6455 family protein n=1 Tax=Marimonas lutisalis TaxID=2545756 RepID=UPI001F1EE625|nr:DUF6455 family protein [Marimonas lutisalis]